MATRLFVVSGPSGVGKGTLIRHVREELPSLGLTVSATTRNPRPGEVDGRDYYFLSDQRFDKLISQDAFIEWAHVHSDRKGTLKSEVAKNLSTGHSVLLELDVQGGLAIKHAHPDAYLIFVAPPTYEELEKRLRARATDDEQDIELRLANARKELEMAARYDCVIVNDSVQQAFTALKQQLLKHMEE